MCPPQPVSDATGDSTGHGKTAPGRGSVTESKVLQEYANSKVTVLICSSVPQVRGTMDT